MKTIYQLAKSELNQLFYSPVAWFILIIFAFQTGMTFSEVFGSQLRSQALGYQLSGITTDTYIGMGGILTRMLRNLYLYIPLITMGLMSREYSSGSIKLLYSSPITNTQIILAKFFSMMGFGAVLISIWLIYLLFGIVTINEIDIPLVLTALLGMYLLICAYSAIGLFMSSLTSYQVVAAVGTLAVLAFFNYVGNLGQDWDFLRDITYWLSLSGRVYPFMEGLITSEDVIYFIIVIALFIIFSIFRLNGQRKKHSFATSCLRYGLVSCIALIIGYFSTLPTFKLYQDVTRTKINTLTPNSQKVIQELTGDMTITTYVNLLDKDFRDGLPRNRKRDIGLFERYLRFKPEIKMNYVYYYDQTPNPSLNEQYPGLSDYERAEKLAKSNNINLKRFLSPEEIRQKIDLSKEKNRFVRIIERGNGQKTVLRVFNDMEKHPSETEITAALKRFIVKGPKVAFLTGHGERNINSTGERFYNIFTKNLYVRRSLVNQGFDVEELLISDKGIPEDIDILVIAELRKPLSDSELEQIHRYIERGGNLFVLNEPFRNDYINPVVSPLGVRFLPGILVFDHKQKYSPDLIVAEVSDEGALHFPGLARIKGWRYGVGMPGSTAIEYTETPGFTAFSVLKSPSQNSWNELGMTDFIDKTPVLHPAIGEKEQAWPTLLALTRKVGEKEQRILISGDADCISNGELSKKRTGINTSNFNMATAVFKWFSYEEYPIDTSRPNLPDNSIRLSKNALPWIKYSAMGILPLLILSAGIILHRIRKGK